VKWQVAKVRDVRNETPHAKTLMLHVPDWPGHRAGQHVDVRLVAEDGYQAQRSYSIASAPENSALELTIERIDDGEVSPYLCDVLHAGDGLEVRGPIGGYFVWNANDGGPLFLIAGGSGIVPLMAMLRHHAQRAPKVPAHLLYSARTRGDLLYMKELEKFAANPSVRVAFTVTREAPSDWRGFTRRIDRAMLEETGWSVAAMPRVFVCGPTSLVESVASTLVDFGHDAARVKTERFGPTG
jgi:ferredoxin-NADP reductase